MDATAAVAIAGAITTLGVAGGGWYFNLKTAKLAHAESRAARYFETRREVYVAVLNSCLNYWTYIVRMDTAARTGDVIPPEAIAGLDTDAERSLLLAQLYASGAPEIVTAAEAFWLETNTVFLAAQGATAIRGAAGPSEALKNTLETLEKRRAKAFARLGALERLVGDDLRAR